MRHRRKTAKVQRKTAHRNALFSNQLGSLVEHRRIRTTLAKAKAIKPLADRLVTLGKRGDLHARRQLIALLKKPGLAAKVIDEISAAHAERKGGYTRITKLGPRMSDAAPMAFIEWVDMPRQSDEDAVSAAVESAAQ
jgi:large subunit ribosomal protein L17